MPRPFPQQRPAIDHPPGNRPRRRSVIVVSAGRMSPLQQSAAAVPAVALRQFKQQQIGELNRGAKFDQFDRAASR